MRALRRRRERREAEAAQKPPDGPRRCDRGEHELTERNTHRDRQGREHCRDCWAKYGPDVGAATG